jgi:hypothetical protein
MSFQLAGERGVIAVDAAIDHGNPHALSGPVANGVAEPVKIDKGAQT